MNCALLPNNTSSQEYHQRLTHPALGQTSGFTNSMYEDVPLSTSVESDLPPPPPISISWARRGAATTSHARE